MKNDRQNQLLQIISEEIIETQEQLLERLQAKGIRVPRPRFPGTSRSCT